MDKSLKLHFDIKLESDTRRSGLIYIRASTLKHLPSKCVPNEDSNQPAHPRSLITVFVVCMKKLCILGYPNGAQ